MHIAILIGAHLVPLVVYANTLSTVADSRVALTWRMGTHSPIGALPFEKSAIVGHTSSKLPFEGFIQGRGQQGIEFGYDCFCVFSHGRHSRFDLTELKLNLPRWERKAEL